MSRRSRRRVLVTVIAAYFTGLGILAGTIIDHVRFDAERSQVLARYEQAADRIRARLMALERRNGPVTLSVFSDGDPTP
jgi:hypothetical protein